MIHLANYSITIADACATKIRGGRVVVIDVLRASSTIVTALANGVEEVKPVDNEEPSDLRDAGYLLAGEYRGVKLPDFDIGNSPTELIEYLKHHKIDRIALKTTNFTTSLYKSGIESAYIGSSLNLSAIMQRLEEDEADANLVVVGSRFGVTEDIAVAMALYNGLNDGLELDEEYIRRCILGCRTARYLLGIGYRKDVEFISQIDMYEVVPVLNNGMIYCE